MASEIKVDTVSEKTSGSGVTIDGLLIKDGGISGDVSLIGTTPTFTIGDAGAEDAALVFDGNAQDFYIALDDSADDLLIGKGSAVGTTPAVAIDENLQVKIVATTASTSATTGSFIAAGGAGVAADLHVGDDVTLISDSAVLGFGADKDTTLTHTDGTGLTLNSTNKLCFNDATQFIQGASGTVLNIAATDEIDLTATLLDVNANLDVSGTTLLPTAGIITAKDLGVGLHIRTSDTSASVDGGADELVIENGSGDGGISILGGTGSSGSIAFGDSGDNNIGRIVYAHGDNKMRLVANATNVVYFGSGEVVFNEDQGDMDFRIESNNNANMFNINAANEHIGFGVAAETYKFRFEGTTSGNYMYYIGNDAGSGNNFIQRLHFMNLDPDDNTSEFLNCFAGSAERLRIFSDGDVQNHDNAYGAISDERIKQNIRDSNSQWDDIKAIKVRNFKKKDDVRKYAENAWEQIGVIAQELETVSPKLIREVSPSVEDILSNSAFGTLENDTDNPILDKDGEETGAYKQKIKEVKAKVKSVNYSILYMKAIKCLQEAQTKIESLEARVTTLED